MEQVQMYREIKKMDIPGKEVPYIPLNPQINYEYYQI
jgi:hypothetical protein